jgi:uncharacterized protein (TIGR04540 family)
MPVEIIKNPRTVKLLAEEIKIVADNYWSRNLEEKKAREMLIYWAQHEGNKLFQGNVINPTVTKIIGSKRCNLVNKWLENTQYSLFS